jgi:hypothetical protein
MRPTAAAYTLGLALHLAPLAAAAPPASTAPPARVERQSRAFQVLLLVAELKGSATLEGIPPNAQKALEDIQNFLPYRYYRLLDVAFLRTDFHAKSNLSGLDGQTYEVAFVVTADASSNSPEKSEPRLQINSFQVVEIPFQPREKVLSVPGVHLEPVTPRPETRLLDTSFDMKIGETVVVGTAKLDGPSKALVVLFSALP